jgi:CRISPR-associated protein Csb1
MSSAPAVQRVFPPLTFEDLKKAVSGNAAAFRCRRRLQPGGGEGDKIFPPTFAGAVYAIEQRRVAGSEQPVTCVLLDSVQSQANRMEQALQDAVDANEIALPVVAVDFSEYGPSGDPKKDEKENRLLDPIGRITSLQVPHRLADAILRDSEYNGEAFRKSVIGRSLNEASSLNATPVYQLCPTALIFGMWDSTGPKGGAGAKFERAIVSEVVGISASLSDFHKNRGVRRDPLEASRTVPIVKNDDGSWSIADDPKKKGVVRPSVVNHGSVPFESDNAGTTISYAEQITTLSLICLRRLRFSTEKMPADQNTINLAGRTVLAALGLCAATLAFESGMGLRSRCLLWPEGSMQWDLLANPGAPAQPYVLDSSGAKKLLEAAAAEAEKVGLTWRKQPLVLKPSAELLKLARLSQQQAVKEGTAEES